MRPLVLCLLGFSARPPTPLLSAVDLERVIARVYDVRDVRVRVGAAVYHSGTRVEFAHLLSFGQLHSPNMSKMAPLVMSHANALPPETQPEVYDRMWTFLRDGWDSVDFPEGPALRRKPLWTAFGPSVV